jgi:hypothetical protein
VTLRADHIAGGAFIALGIVVFAIGWDLPFGRISAPGAGMLPKLMAGLMILFAIGIMVTGSTADKWSDIRWDDKWHAALLVGITGAAVALYTTLGFLLTMSLLVFTLLVVVERRNILIAAIYAVALTLFAYWLFGIALKAPLERGLFWL